MASIQSLLEPTPDTYNFHTEKLPSEPPNSSDFSVHEDAFLHQAEKESTFSNIDLTSFKRVNKRTSLGFGSRSFPPKINCSKADLFHIKRSATPGIIKKKHAALETIASLPKPYKFSRDQKMRGFMIDKDFRTRKWHTENISVPLVCGKILENPGYTATPPLKRRFLQERPYREIFGLRINYLVSTVTRPIARPSPVTPAPTPIVHLRAPINNHLIITSSSKSLKERMSCPVSNCLKDFADRSSLNRHKKRMHPELTTSRSSLSRP